MDVILTRFSYGKHCTLGWLRVAHLRLATLEEPWSPNPYGPGGNKREPGHYESCVPDGEYALFPHNGLKYQNVYCLVNTTLGVYRSPGDIPAGQRWGRAAILIHSGNTVQDTVGCILVGLDHDGPERIMGGTSRVALDALRDVLKDRTHRLIIQPTKGTGER